MTARLSAGTQAIDLERFLQQNEEKELLRLTTAGSVDDGKSTLIGRLLYDSKGVYEDQIAAVKKASSNGAAGALDFALITDGLRAEREQGITIDVAYRYFSTPKRKFIIADTPGHEQYTRNMATGASTANLAIILVDARKGVLPQSRRHAFIASLLGIPHLVIAINKMDLVDFSEEVFEHIRWEFTGFAARLQVSDLQFIPISALNGDNVVEKSSCMPWYEGPSLLHHLETVHIASDRNLTEMRFPVQYVIRAHQDFRGYAGQVASGIVNVGDPVMALPSGKTSRIRDIVTYDGSLPKAFPPMSVTLRLEDEVDISRGDLLVSPTHLPHISRRLDARIVWMNEKALESGREYLLKHTTQIVRARAVSVRYRINMHSLEKESAARLGLNDVGAAVFETNRPVFFDPYRRNRSTGSFILLDPITNETVAAGMITGRPPVEAEPQVSRHGIGAGGRVAPAERESRAGHRAMVLWMPVNPEFAYRVERRLFDRGCFVQVLAGEGDIRMLARLARSGLAAGMLVVCVPEAAGEEAALHLREAVGPSQFLPVDPPDPPDDLDAAAERICRILEAHDIIRRHQDW